MIYFFILLLVLLIISLYYLYKFALVLIELQDVINESLELLDNKFKIISKILQTPVFFDSQEVRRVLKELEDIKVLVLYIANRLANSLNKKEIEKQDE